MNALDISKYEWALQVLDPSWGTTFMLVQSGKLARIMSWQKWHYPNEFWQTIPQLGLHPHINQNSPSPHQPKFNRSPQWVLADYSSVGSPFPHHPNFHQTTPNEFWQAIPQLSLHLHRINQNSIISSQWVLAGHSSVGSLVQVLHSTNLTSPHVFPCNRLVANECTWYLQIWMSTTGIGSFLGNHLHACPVWKAS